MCVDASKLPAVIGRLPIDQLRQVAITVVTGDEFTNRVSRVIGILDRGQAANPADPFE
jgi:hypothetical protein